MLRAGIKITPHAAQNIYESNTKTGKRARRESSIEARAANHPGYAVSHVIPKLTA
jgi:hypothetical protein